MHKPVDKVRQAAFLVDGSLEHVDERRDSPKVATDPKNGCADLLVCERRQRDSRNVRVHPYQLLLVKIESDIANTNITTFVPTMAPACQSGDALSRNGCDGMIWSQNRTPVTKKLACISQM